MAVRRAVAEGIGSRNARRSSRAGVWLGLLALLLNLLAGVMLGLPHAVAASSAGGWGEICTLDGVRTLDEGGAGGGGNASPFGGYCPHCPLRSAAGDDAADLLAAAVVVSFVRLPLPSGTDVSWGDDREDSIPPLPAVSSISSRGPPFVS